MPTDGNPTLLGQLQQSSLLLSWLLACLDLETDERTGPITQPTGMTLPLMAAKRGQHERDYLHPAPIGLQVDGGLRRRARAVAIAHHG